MKVSDDMVEAACRAVAFTEPHEKRFIKIALEAAMKVYAMERLVEAGAEQMEQEGDNG